MHPGPPRAVPSEPGRQLVVIARQVVLGEQIHLERRSHRLGKGRLIRRPRESGLAGEVAAATPRHPFVRQPLLGHRQMAIEIRGDRGLELAEQLHVGQMSHAPSAPTYNTSVSTGPVSFDALAANIVARSGYRFTEA